MNVTEQFFYDNAGFSYPSDATPEEREAAHVASAQGLARAEERLKSGPYYVDVVPDDMPWDGDVPYDGPLWNVDLYSVADTARPELIGSLGGVAVESETDPYIRVVSAELASQYIPN